MNALAILSRIKKAHPEMRILQIIMNALPQGETYFYMTDAQLASNLQIFEQNICVENNEYNEGLLFKK
jgi:hypothetical protein